MGTCHRHGGVAEASADPSHTAGNATTEAVDVEAEREDLLNLVLEAAGDLITAHIGHRCRRG